VNGRRVDPDELLRLCTFVVGRELFAIDIMRIREIVRPLPVTPVPKSPFGMLGVIDLRGAVLPVFDLRLRFDVPARSAAEDVRSRYLIVNVGHRQLGLVVDDVRDVVDVTRRDLRAGPNVLSGDAARYFVGLCPVGDRLALLLNLHRLISEEDRVAIDGLSSTGARAAAEEDGPEGRP
jgi:purine-binding chemotaxis protein CheW